MKNIHLLPTTQKSKIFFNHNEGFEKYQFSKEPFINGLTNTTNQNIYITSDEEIKEGGWVLFISTNEVIKVPLGGFKGKVCKKIILTTDQDLIKDGVQAIPDEFLEWFVKNPSCEKVEVINEIQSYKSNRSEKWIYEYKIIIPKEETEQKLYTEEEVKGLLKRFAPHIRYNHKELPHTWSQVVQEWFAENKK